MSVTVLIPTGLQVFTNHQESIKVNGKNVKEVLCDLVKQFPNLKKHLYNEKNELRSFINIYLNDEDIRHLKSTETAVKNNDTLTVVPSIAGGSGAGPDGNRGQVLLTSKRGTGLFWYSKQDLSPFLDTIPVPCFIYSCPLFREKEND